MKPFQLKDEIDHEKFMASTINHTLADGNGPLLEMRPAERVGNLLRPVRDTIMRGVNAMVLDCQAHMQAFSSKKYYSIDDIAVLQEKGSPVRIREGSIPQVIKENGRFEVLYNGDQLDNYRERPNSPLMSGYTIEKRGEFYKNTQFKVEDYAKWASREANRTQAADDRDLVATMLMYELANDLKVDQKPMPEKDRLKNICYEAKVIFEAATTAEDLRGGALKPRQKESEITKGIDRQKENAKEHGKQHEAEFRREGKPMEYGG